MTTANSVLGVLGVCRVGFGNSTRVEASNYAAFRVVCWVCWVLHRACACVMFLVRLLAAVFFSYASTEKPNKPNTPNTNTFNTLFLKGFKCVGFVLGWAFLCWVGGEA